METMLRSADAMLAARLMERDESALREVIDLYGGLVNGMARRVLAEPTLAEEVAHDAFLALWRRPGAYDPERGSLKTFLTSVVRHKAIDLVRREEAVKRMRSSLVEEFAVAPRTERFDERIERSDEIVQALRQLSDLQREAIALAYFGGRTYQEVANELGIAEGTAKTRLRDGLQRLRTVMTQTREVDDD